jgi:hypothetical protein
MSVSNNNPIPRIQKRQTQAYGDPVPDNEWTIVSDTGPISSSPTPTPTPSQVDVFGKKKIYADMPGFSNWAMNMNDPHSDPRANNPESSSYMPKFTKNVDGTWKIKDQTEIRWAISQDNGYNQSKLCTDFQKCQKQGFMQDNKDWGTPPSGLEMTAYYRINAANTGTSNGEGHIEHVMKGGRSTTSNTIVGVCNCALGCSNNLHGNTYFNALHGLAPGPARQKWEKDLKHTTGYSTDVKGVNNSSAYNFQKGKLFGIKTIVYNNPTNGNTEMEHWTDENGDNSWKKTHHWEDTGSNWPPRGDVSLCNVGTDHRINFGGPLSVFRSDNLLDYDIAYASIRSVDITKPLQPASEHAKRFSDTAINEDDIMYQEERSNGVAS